MLDTWELTGAGTTSAPQLRVYPAPCIPPAATAAAHAACLAGGVISLSSGAHARHRRVRSALPSEYPSAAPAYSSAYRLASPSAYQSELPLVYRLASRSGCPSELPLVYPVGVAVGVSVGVAVGVSVGGTGVLVGVLVGVSVGGTGVFVGVLVGVFVGVFVGGTGVFVGVGVGVTHAPCDGFVPRHLRSAGAALVPRQQPLQH